MKISPKRALNGLRSPSALPLSFFQQVLTSAREGVHLAEWGVTSSVLPQVSAAAWSIGKRTLRGGRQEGVDVIEVDNGRLRFAVSPTRGMGVLKVESGDLRLGWSSPVKEVVHPQFINLESRGGLGWLEGFGEWMTRCGLEWAGHPGKDTFRNNVGDEVEMNLTLHGKIANIPASEVEVSIEAGSPPRIHVRGLVEERMFYGPKLSLCTDISTELGSNSLRIQDTITNQSSHNQEFQIIYHANFGPPLLEAGTRFFGAVKEIRSFNAHAAQRAKTYDTYSGPQAGFVEQVYCLHPLAAADGRTEMLLQNAKGDRGVSLEFPVSQLPFVTLWKNLAAEAEGYVTGIEPGTGFPNTRRLEREAGRVPKLAPDETRCFSIDFALHDNAPAVGRAKRRIQKIQGKTKPTLD